MGGQKGRGVVFVVAVAFLQPGKEVFHAVGVKSGVDERLKADSVGFAFGVPGKFKLILNQSPLCSEGNRHGGVTPGGAARLGGQKREKN